MTPRPPSPWLTLAVCVAFGIAFYALIIWLIVR